MARFEFTECRRREYNQFICFVKSWDIQTSYVSPIQLLSNTLQYEYVQCPVLCNFEYFNQSPFSKSKCPFVNLANHLRKVLSAESPLTTRFCFFFLEILYFCSFPELRVSIDENASYIPVFPFNVKTFKVTIHKRTV